MDLITQYIPIEYLRYGIVAAILVLAAPWLKNAPVVGKLLEMWKNRAAPDTSKTVGLPSDELETAYRALRELDNIAAKRGLSQEERNRRILEGLKLILGEGSTVVTVEAKKDGQ